MATKRDATYINSQVKAGDTAMRKGLEHYRNAGERLAKVRNELKGAKRKGSGFRAWIEENLDCKKDQAYRYIQLFEGWERLSLTCDDPDDLSLRQALKILADERKTENQLSDEYEEVRGTKERDTISGLKAQLTKAKEDHEQTLSQTHKDYQDKLAQTNEARQQDQDQAHERFTNATKELEQTNQDKDELSKQVAELQAALKAAKETINQQTEELKTKEESESVKRAKELQSQITKRDEQIDGLKLEVESLNRSIKTQSNLETKVAELEESNKQLKQELKDRPTITVEKEIIKTVKILDEAEIQRELEDRLYEIGYDDAFRREAKLDEETLGREYMAKIIRHKTEAGARFISHQFHWQLLHDCYKYEEDVTFMQDICAACQQYLVSRALVLPQADSNLEVELMDCVPLETVTKMRKVSKLTDEELEDLSKTV